MSTTAHRTDVAGSAQSVAKAINAMLANERLAPAEYVPELMALKEQSTGGGVRALQRIRLVPRRSGNPTLVIGSVNMKEKAGELRSFAYVDAAFQRQFKYPVPLVRSEYEALVARVLDLLKQSDISAVVKESPGPTDLEDDEAVATSRGRSIAVLIAVLVALAVALLWLRRG